MMEGSYKGCGWLHAPILLRESTAVTVVGVADLASGLVPSAEELLRIPKFAAEELSVALVGSKADGAGAADCMRARARSQDAPTPTLTPPRSAPYRVLQAKYGPPGAQVAPHAARVRL